MRGSDGLEQNVVDEVPRTVASRFELAASRIAEAWLSAGHVSVTADDLHMACEFLARTGITVEQTPGVLVRILHRDGRHQDTTREGAVLLALRSLARRP